MKRKTHTHRPNQGSVEESAHVSPAFLTVEEAAKLLRIGRNTCYDLIRAQRIPHIRLGRLIRVPSQSLSQWLSDAASLDRSEKP